VPSRLTQQTCFGAGALHDGVRGFEAFVHRCGFERDRVLLWVELRLPLGRGVRIDRPSKGGLAAGGGDSGGQAVGLA
jgi:hypothetical protein